MSIEFELNAFDNFLDAKGAIEVTVNSYIDINKYFNSSTQTSNTKTVKKVNSNNSNKGKSSNANIRNSSKVRNNYKQMPK